MFLFSSQLGNLIIILWLLEFFTTFLAMCCLKMLSHHNNLI